MTWHGENERCRNSPVLEGPVPAVWGGSPQAWSLPMSAADITATATGSGGKVSKHGA